MTRNVIAGGVEGDYLPTGEFAVGVLSTGPADRGSVVTHLGTVPSPDFAGIRYAAITAKAGFSIAGQAESTPTYAWEYFAGTWRQRTDLPMPAANFALIYDNNGVLHVDGGADGSQGYRYVDANNVIHTGDQTYGPFDGLNEYTDLGGGFLIGQSNATLAALVYDNTDPTKPVWRVLETGYRSAIRAHHGADDTVTIAMRAPEGCILLKTSMAELRALPLFVPPPPAPAPVPVDKVIPPVPVLPPSATPNPVPTPTPTPSTGMDYVTSQLTDAQLRALIASALQAANSNDDPNYWFQVIRQHPTPAGQNDWLYWAGRIATGDGVGKGYAGPGTTQTPPPAPAPTVDLTPILTELAALQERIAALEVKPVPELPDMSTFARHGDTVQVTGSVDLNQVIGNRMNTWTGKIL